MLKNTIISLLLLTGIFGDNADVSTINGKITQISNGDPLPGANIWLSGTTIGAAADFNGLYTIIDIPTGKHELRITMIGYKMVVDSITIDPGLSLEKNYALVSTTVDLPAIVVSAERLGEQTAVSDMSFDRLVMRNKHGLVADPIQVIRTMPGVSTSDDLFSPSQLYVRGGGPDENTFLLDWTKVYWPWYMGGIKSVFNTDVVNKIELLTGGFPAKYGNALSSILNITTREGNPDRYSGEFTFGFMNSQVLLEGPMGEKANFLATGRRTYLDLIMKESASFPVPTWYDFNVSATYRSNLKNTLAFNGFYSQETMEYITADPDPGVPDRIITDSGLNTQSIIWNSVISDKMYSKLALTRSYSLASVEVGKNINMDIEAGVIGIREDITWQISPTHEFKTGFEYSIVNFEMDASVPLDPRVMDPTDTTVMTIEFNVEESSAGSGAYIQDTWQVFDQFDLTGGIRFDHNGVTDKSDWSPRISARYRMTEKTALRGAWGKYYQFPDLSHTALEPDLLSRLVTHNIIGISHTFNHSYSGWVEFYNKDYDQLITIDTTQTPNHYANNGIGYSRGFEVFLQKNSGVLNGWVSYALSEAKRREYTDSEINYFDYDQRHLFSTVLEYHTPNPSKVIPAYVELNFRYASGKPYTPVLTAMQNLTGGWEPVYGNRNSERDDPYINLNLRFGWKFKIAGKYNAESFFEIWNALNIKNILGRTYHYGPDYPNNVAAQEHYTTPILPAGGFVIVF